VQRFVKDHIDDKNCVALVLEDDAILKDDFAVTLKEELPKIPSGWDFLSLEGSKRVCEGGVWQSEGINLWHPIKASEHYAFSPPSAWSGIYTGKYLIIKMMRTFSFTNNYSLGGYLVTTKGAMRILQNLPMTSNIDTWINVLAFYNRLTLSVRCPGNLH